MKEEFCCETQVKQFTATVTALGKCPWCRYQYNIQAVNSGKVYCAGNFCSGLYNLPCFSSNHPKILS